MAQEAEINAIIEEFVPIIRRFAVGPYAISIGGSRGKKLADRRSDVDFRLYCDGALKTPETRAEFSKLIHEGMARWRAKGIEIDGCWVRTVAEIDQALSEWLDGKIKPADIFWTIWGYHVLPDIYHQWSIEDPYDIIAGWKERLKQYPPKLKQAILDKYLFSLRYWRDDYHYLSKVHRSDVIFLAGLSARLVHDMCQVLFALNETYFVGDGNNLDFIQRFAVQPPRFMERVREALYPAPG